MLKISARSCRFTFSVTGVSLKIEKSTFRCWIEVPVFRSSLVTWCVPVIKSGSHFLTNFPGVLMKQSLADNSLRDLTAGLAQANNDFAKTYPGETGKRQPVHTVYVPADRYGAGLVPAAMERYRAGADIDLMN